MKQFTVRIRTSLPLILLTLLLTACGSSSRLNLKASYTEQDIYHDGLFGAPTQLINLDEVFALTPAQREAFLKTFHSKEYRKLSDSQRIYKFLEHQLDNFNFHSRTLVATDAMAQNAGNCMSLAILTRALSQLTHVGISYELARTPPVYQLEGNLQLSSQHIRTVVYNKTATTTKQFVKPNDKVRIDYFSTLGSRTLRKVKKQEFHALFYSNRAAEAMIDGDHNLAYWNLKEALHIQPDNLVAINMLGVLYDRIGANEYAERAYIYGLSFSQGHLELMNNYHKFLVNAGRLNEAQMIANELENYNDPDPFKWLDLANQEMAQANYRKAIKFYEKAAELADYMHQPYAGIAKASFELGLNAQAIRAMQQALENSHTAQTTSIYQAKYDLIKAQKNLN
ncbi:tetratricopeptide repeat protein [Marinicella meishanensis]|uniref:tetratricopeptide repeat protein n=1 Tax=Marinicella meishanensis TaxID=2873263 RepID=UPI001CBD6936|nr:hypothetical protein [Marinicella sp. NBU2979]